MRVYDDRSGCSGGESGDSLPGGQTGWDNQVRQADGFSQGQGVRSAPKGAPALAHRCFLHQHPRDFYYLCSVLDGCSRYLVHCEIREQMKERDVEVIIQRAVEKFPGAQPRIISDNGPQFIARDFKEFVRVSGMTHVRTRKQKRLQSRAVNRRLEDSINPIAANGAKTNECQGSPV